MSYLFKNYLRANIEFIKANGNELIDQTGRSYIDFSSGIGVTNLGFNEDVKRSRRTTITTHLAFAKYLQKSATRKSC